MPVVTLDDVQQWLERTKLTLTAYDPKFEETARTTAFGRLSAAYDVTGWSDAASTPLLVRHVIAMYVAAWTYNRAYSEVDGTSEYATWLESKADALLEGIVSGRIDLAEVAGLSASAGGPSFYPNDTTEFDGTGNEIKFKMGTVW